MRVSLTQVACCAAALGLLAATAGCGSGPQANTVTIMIPWSGTEFGVFYDGVIKPFEEKSGIHVDVEVTRAQDQQLNAAVAAGNPPDLAVLPSAGEVSQYAQKELQQLDVDPKAYVEPFRGLMMVGGKVYAIPVKADVKSLIWYDPAFMPHPPTTLPALLALSARKGNLWCLGLASGPTSGWPGADWIADILLAKYGAAEYENWLTSKPDWTAPQIKDAWTTWRILVGRSLPGALATAFNGAAGGMTNNPPTCYLAHGALSAMGFSAGADHNYELFSASRLEVSADFVGMFAAHNPSATALLRYLSGKDAQTAWVKAEDSGAFSADSDVQPADYPSGIRRDIATLFQPNAHHTLCFTAADTMKPDLSIAFYRAVMKYASGSLSLKTILTDLDTIQEKAGSPPIPPADICTSP
jgi:alpha-glucoside transport system substrate-binding protein